jgi:UTP--glucose-1-phosphate uridylyltransferase
MREEKLAYRFARYARHDCGSKLGYLQATVALGLKHLKCAANSPNI